MTAGSRKLPFRTIPALLLSLTGIAIAWVSMAYVAIENTRAMRVRLTQERNLTTARLTARLLDEQVGDALLMIRAFARSEVLGSALGKEDLRETGLHLRTLAVIEPGLRFVAVYDKTGALLSAGSSAADEEAMGVSAGHLAQSVMARGETQDKAAIALSQENDQSLLIACPIFNEGHAVGCLVGRYSLGKLTEWLTNTYFGKGGCITLLNDRSEPMLSIGGESLLPQLVSRYFRQTPTLQDGNGVIDLLAGRRAAIVGYAYSHVVSWMVVVSLPLESALGPTNYLVNRLSLLLFPILLVLAALTSVLMRFYRRQHELALQLATQNDQLREMDSVKSDFLANISHDLKTPLAGMKVSLSGLLAQDVRWDSEQIRGTLKLMHEEVDQLTARVQNLLTMARLDAGMLPLIKEPCDLTDIVSGAVERLKPLLEGREIQAQFPPEPLMVECDQPQIETVIMNLLENALNYSPPDQPILLSGERTGDRVLFSVADRGPGIAQGEEIRIFEKFYRARQESGVMGTGLGLPICKSIVEEHGGEVGVSARVGGGAIFWFILTTFDFEE